MLQRFLFVTLLLHGFSLSNSAKEVQTTLYINRGTFTTVNNTTFPSLAFNTTPVYSTLNAVIHFIPGDTLIVTVVNNDTSVHGFTVKDYAGISALINPSDSITDTLFSATQRLFIYYDHYNYPDNRYLGLAGMICVSDQTTRKFYWNIKEHQTQYNNDLASGNPVDWTSYEPDYFTINGNSFPDLQNDTTARVTGNVGDTILIFVVNTGQSTHSIHFHGFHCRTLFSTQSIQTDWEKDTYPARSMEGYLLLLLPDKAGQYSVHDHNLVAVSGGGIHPNGMFIIMDFQ